MVSVRTALIAVLVTVSASPLAAAELIVQVPDPLLPGQELSGNLVIVDAPAQPRNLDLPEVPGLAITLDNRNRRIEEINGRRRESYALGFRPERAGRYEIPPVTLTLADGSQLVSEPVSVEAWEPQSWLQGSVVVRAAFDSEQALPGEEVALRWRVASPVTRSFIAEAGSAPELPPGLVPEGSPERVAVGMARDLEGAIWRVDTWRMPVLAVRPGDYQVGGTLSVGVEERDFVRSRFRKVMDAPVRPAELTVEAFPSEGRPDDFTGVVGPVTIAAQLDHDTITLGEGTRLILSLRGDQVDLLDRPRVPAVDGLRLRPVDLADDGAEEPDLRRFAWNVQPERSGTFRIPPFELSWFDVDHRRYRRSSGPVRELEVLPGRRRDLDVAGYRPEATGDTAAALPGPALLQPLRGSGAARSATASGWWSLALGALVASIAGAGLRLWRARPRRGRSGDLRRALAAGDLAAIDRALHAQRPQVVEPAARQRLETLASRVQSARYGSGHLDPELRAELEAWSRQR